jgi:hypothetical protein
MVLKLGQKATKSTVTMLSEHEYLSKKPFESSKDANDQKSEKEVVL